MSSIFMQTFVFYVIFQIRNEKLVFLRTTHRDQSLLLRGANHNHNGDIKEIVTKIQRFSILAFTADRYCHFDRAFETHAMHAYTIHMYQWLYATTYNDWQLLVSAFFPSNVRHKFTPIKIPHNQTTIFQFDLHLREYFRRVKEDQNKQ